MDIKAIETALSLLGANIEHIFNLSNSMLAGEDRQEEMKALYQAREALDNIRGVLENVVAYCEDQAIYDKLGGKYGDFYYKIKKILD